MHKLKNIFHKKDNKIKLNDITIENIKNEIHREKYKHSFSKLLKSTLYVLIIILASASLAATLFMPVVEITDSSMKPLLNDGDIVLTIKKQSLNKGDIVAFYHGNKILIKRVIAVEGDIVNIDKDGKVYVNAEELKESYVKELIKGESDIKYPVSVSGSSIFVLSDERDIMTDSRIESIGLIKKEDIIGKVIFRVWPIKQIKKI